MSHTFFHGFRNLLCLLVTAAGLTLLSCAPGPGTVAASTQTALPTLPTVTSPVPTSLSTVTASPPTATPERIASSSADCSSLRSVEGSVLTSITFENWSGRAVNVYWVDYQGSEQFWFELQPGQSLEQGTYATHPWCARDKSTGAPRLAVVATEGEQVATVLGEIEWQETVALPNVSSAPFDSFRGQQLIIHNGHVYIFGGRSAADERLTQVLFSAIQPEGALTPWQETTPLPAKYYDHVVVKAGDHVYLLTGADGADDVYFAPFNADGSVGTWKETAPLSPSRQTFAAASDGNFIYATGGNSGGIQNFVQYTSVNADGTLNPWQYTTPLPEAVQEHTMIAYDGYLYVIGGKGPDYAWGNNVYVSAIQPDGRLADWETTTPLPRELRGFAAFEANGYVYLLAGRSAYYSRVLENHGLGQWQNTTSLPALRNGLRVGAYNGYAYAIGGQDAIGHQSTVYQGDLVGGIEGSDCTSGWTRLRVDRYAEVSRDQPSPNRVREKPDTSAKIIYQIYAGTIVRVVEGPVCTNGLVFWKVENSLIPGGTGWTAEGDGQEYYLEPVQ